MLHLLSRRAHVCVPCPDLTTATCHDWLTHRHIHRPFPQCWAWPCLTCWHWQNLGGVGGSWLPATLLQDPAELACSHLLHLNFCRRPEQANLCFGTRAFRPFTGMPVDPSPRPNPFNPGRSGQSYRIRCMPFGRNWSEKSLLMAKLCPWFCASEVFTKSVTIETVADRRLMYNIWLYLVVLCSWLPDQKPSILVPA